MLRVGASSQPITPESRVELAGFGYNLDRLSTGIGSELQATAIALQADDTSAVICGVDLLSIDAGTVDKVKGAVAQLRPGQPEPTLFINASHTHSGPGIRSLVGTSERNVDYIDSILVPRLAGTIASAFEQVRDGAVGTKSHDLPGLSFNRTDGPTVDRRLTAIQFVNDRQKIVGANFACHPVVFEKGSKLISSDYPGVARRVLQQETGGDQTFWVTGFSGDINPTIDPSLSAEQNARSMGTAIGRMAGILDEQICTTEPGLETLSTTVDLPIDTDFELDITTELDMFREARKLLKTADVSPVKRWLENAQTIVNNNLAETLGVPLTIIKMGRITFVGLGAEIYSSTGLDIQSAHSQLDIVAAMNTNEHQGYIPIERDYELGNYAARSSAFAFGRKPLMSKSEDILFQTVDMHLGQLSGSY
jgi:hypothetical protein